MKCQKHKCKIVVVGFKLSSFIIFEIGLSCFKISNMNALKNILYLISFSFFTIGVMPDIDADPLGYIVYCPCMGRFGNQADHFLGALSFAHALNRTLVLPPWIEYRYGQPKSIQVPFDQYFKVETLRQYHKVLTMEEFMAKIAPHEWPPNKRISFCYMTRGGDEKKSCNAKEGNPFGPFWDTYAINFVDSEFYGPLHYDVHHHNIVKEWNRRYPPKQWQVLAFTGAPASFPVQEENRKLHKYLKWSEAISSKAANFIKNVLPKGAFIGIHLRNGIDWVRACEHIKDSPNLFAAPQCLGYRNEKGKATQDMCFPTKETIIRQLKRVIKAINNSGSKDRIIRSVFVASDSNHMINDLNEALRRMNVEVFKYPENNPHVDLAILGQSNHFIGNCISSYTAFVKRERDVHNFSSSFWAFPKEKSKSNIHDEL